MIHDLAVKPHHERKLSATQPDRAFCDRIEHWLNIGRRTRNDAEYFRRRRLLLQRLSELIEQPRVLDGDDGLRSKVLHQFDLLVGERQNFLTIDDNRADQHVFLEQWYAECGPTAPEFDGRNHIRIAFDIRLYLLDVGDVDRLFASRYTTQNAIYWRPDCWLALARFSIRGRGVMRGHHAKSISVAEIQRTELSLTDAGRIFQHGLEYRLQCARRRTDDAQHVRRGCLLLKRLLQFVEQPRVLDGDNGLGGEVLY